MKHSLKFFRCSCVLLLALIVAFSAAIGVSAEEATANGAFLYINPIGEIVRVSENTNNSLSSTSYNKFGFRTPLIFANDNTYIVTFTLKFNNINPISLFTDNTICCDFGSNVFTLESQLINGNLTNNVNVLLSTDNNTVTYILTFNSSGIDSSSNLFQYFFNSNLSNNINISYSYINTTVYYTYDPEETALNQINQKLDDIINNQTSSNIIISNKLTEIINNQTISNNNWNTIINYGSNYNQIDSNLIGNLGTAEDQLSSAEDALENKSQSLKDSVASQWQQIQSTSKTFITNIAPAAAAVGTVTTQFMDAAPEEVKGLFVTIPLLIFIGWLIGRIRGD